MRASAVLSAVLAAALATAAAAFTGSPDVIGSSGGGATTGREALVAAAAPDRPYDTAFVADDYEYCLTCHGAEGQGNAAIGAPVLAGMESWYLRGQLEAFRAGWRGTHDEDLYGMEMRPSAMALATGQLSEVVAFVGALPARRAPITLAGNAPAGGDIYSEACASCHGEKAEGRKALAAPALAYQADWYLVRQLENYRAGIRGGDPADAPGSTMRAANVSLADAESVRDVVAYIKTLGAGSP